METQLLTRDRTKKRLLLNRHIKVLLRRKWREGLRELRLLRRITQRGKSKILLKVGRLSKNRLERLLIHIINRKVIDLKRTISLRCNLTTKAKRKKIKPKNYTFPILFKTSFLHRQMNRSQLLLHK